MSQKQDKLDKRAAALRGNLVKRRPIQKKAAKDAIKDTNKKDKD